MQNQILPDCITQNYDFKSLKNRVLEIYSLFEYLKLVDNNIVTIAIYSNTKIINIPNNLYDTFSYAVKNIND